MIDFIVELIQSLFLIIAAIIIVIAAIGIFRIDDDMDKAIYVRMHMFGMLDIAFVLATIGLGQFIFAGIYFVLAPFWVHAMANAYLYSEDERKYETCDELTCRIDDNAYNELACSNDTTIDAKFRKNFENRESIESKESIESRESVENKDLIDSRDSIESKESIEIEESIETKEAIENIKTLKSTKGVLIKEVSTDDIENINLIQKRGEEHD